MATVLMLLALTISLFPQPGLGADGDTTPKRLTGVLNINTATAEQFTRLRGVNEELAKKIVKFREANGAFGSIEDIMKVEGFTEKLFSLNQFHLAVSGDITLKWVKVK